MAFKGIAAAPRNGKRLKPKAVAVIVDHVTDENNDGAADIEDVKLFLKRYEANRIALKGNDQYPGGDFRRHESVDFRKQADIVVTNLPFSRLSTEQFGNALFRMDARLRKSFIKSAKTFAKSREYRACIPIGKG